MRYYHLFFAVLLLETVSLSGQSKLEKTEAKWENIPKLVVPPGRTIQLKSNFLQIDTLIMHPSSGLSLAQGDNVIIVGHATIGPRARITGRGKNGVNGQNGRSGEPAPRLPGTRDGANGTNGTNGGNAPNLKLYIGAINNRSNLNVVLTGGNGGDGGKGGDGGTKTIKCTTIKVKGTNGGDGGKYGLGGRAGVLTLVLGNKVERKVITYRSTAGQPGRPGIGGSPGWLIMKCLGTTHKSRPGLPGNGISFGPPITLTPDTNPDFLEFPSPVPKPSASKLVPINIPAGSSFGTVEAKLKSALHACGYNDLNYRRYEDGFAIFTGMEHITSEGIPLTGNDRFSPKKFIFHDDPSFITFLESLFIARKGYSRIIVFIVTDEGISTKPGGVARSEAITWFTAGIDELPKDIGKRPYTDKHHLKALIYEFSIRENGSEPVFSEPPSTIGADQHLKRTRLWSLLTTQ